MSVHCHSTFARAVWGTRGVQSMTKTSFFFSAHHYFWVAPMPNPRATRVFVPYNQSLQNFYPRSLKTALQGKYQSFLSRDMENKNPDKLQILPQVMQELSSCVMHSPCWVPAFVFPLPWWEISCHLFPLNLKKYLGTLQKSSFPREKNVSLPLTTVF